MILSIIFVIILLKLQGIYLLTVPLFKFYGLNFFFSRRTFDYLPLLLLLIMLLKDILTSLFFNDNELYFSWKTIYVPRIIYNQFVMANYMLTSTTSSVNLFTIDVSFDPTSKRACWGLL